MDKVIHVLSKESFSNELIEEIVANIIKKEAESCIHTCGNLKTTNHICNLLCNETNPYFSYLMQECHQRMKQKEISFSTFSSLRKLVLDEIHHDPSCPNYVNRSKEAVIAPEICVLGDHLLNQLIECSLTSLIPGEFHFQEDAPSVGQLHFPFKKLFQAKLLSSTQEVSIYSTNLFVLMERKYSIQYDSTDVTGERAKKWCETVLSTLDSSILEQLGISKYEIDPKGFLRLFISQDSHIAAPLVPSKAYPLGTSTTPPVVPLPVVAYTTSCFRNKFGIPRQPSFITSSRAIIHLVDSVPDEVFHGLEEYSHVWILYLFHENAPEDQLPKAPGENIQVDQPIRFSSIRPPKLSQNKKRGVFATRAPHRPAPIGISVAKIERIYKRQLYVSSIDLLHMTPIIDIKPYHIMDASPVISPSVLRLGSHYRKSASEFFNKDFALASWVDEAVKNIEVIVSFTFVKEFCTLFALGYEKKSRSLTGKTVSQLLEKATSQWGGSEDSIPAGECFEFLKTEFQPMVQDLQFRGSEKQARELSAFPPTSLFERPCDFFMAIHEILLADPRSQQQIRQEHGSNFSFFDLDGFNFTFRFVCDTEEKKTILVNTISTNTLTRV